MKTISGFSRRQLLGLGAASLASQGWAQGSAPRTMRLVVPFPAGGVTDFLSRAVADLLSRRLAHPIIVENRPGAGGNIGADVVAKAVPDGMTVLMGPIGPIAVNPALYPRMPFDPAKDLMPVVHVASLPNVLVANSALPIANCRDLIAYAQANPGKLSYASFGNGSSAHLCGELFKRLAKVEMVHVPYRGSPPAMQDLIGGQVQLMFDSLPTALPQLNARKVRALGVTSRRRSETVPEVPSIAETAGLADFDLTAWFGLFVPAGTPAESVSRLNGETNAILQETQLRARMFAQGATVVGGSPKAFASFVAAESIKWQSLVRSAQIKAD